MKVLQRRRSTAPRSQPAQASETGRAAGAHIFGRATMHPHPDRDDAGQSTSELLSSIFDDDLIERHQAAKAPTVGVKDEGDDNDDLRNEDVTEWWLEQMIAPDSGLVDRIAWFWHGHLTTNYQKASDPLLISTQLDTFRQSGLGNYRTLLHEIITGGAMLQYLDASYSEASNPNENLARELMELFTIGRGNYNEDDVRAAARALSGWIVSSDDDGPTTVVWHRDRAFIAPLLFLGEQAKWDTTLVVDRLCDDPATATLVASKLWDHLVRQPLSEAGRAELGSWWHANDLEIRPLVERILSDDAFAASAGAGVRTPVEWWCAAATAAKFESEGVWSISRLGQIPYEPPNVGGWPSGDRWLSAGSMLARSRFSWNLEPDPGDGLPSDTDGILERCSLFHVADSTRQAIEAVASVPDIDQPTVLASRWRLALCSPEFQFS